MVGYIAVDTFVMVGHIAFDTFEMVGTVKIIWHLDGRDLLTLSWFTRAQYYAEL